LIAHGVTASGLATEGPITATFPPASRSGR